MRYLVIIFALALSSFASAKPIQVELEVSISGDNSQEIDPATARKEGWVKAGSEDEPLYKKSVVIEDNKLPYQTGIGDVSFSISKSGLVSLGASIGDADAGASSELQWPTKLNKMIPLGFPLALSSSGGEYASSAWQFEAKAVIKY
jgi:hypothetical protein